MAAVVQGNDDDGRRGAAPSPKPKGREGARDTLCRNVTIYGYCRNEDKGCAFNHNPSKTQAPPVQTDSFKKRLNVDSPSFTPSSLTNSGPAVKSVGISPKAANAAPFKPKGLTSATGSLKQYNPNAPDWAAPETQDYLPQTYQASSLGESNGTLASSNQFDQFTPPSSTAGSSNNMPQQAHTNPYAQETNAMAGTPYYQSQNNYTQPLQYHLYASLGPHRENLLPYQRASHDFFISDDLREELQRKSAATLQTLPNSTLPIQIDHFHSLVPLDTSNLKNAALFGYPSWVYKAVSSKDGNTYVLRRLEGYRLTNEKAIRSMQAWKRIDNANVVTIIDVFTNRSFGDSSLIFIMDYHPLSKTLYDHHFPLQPRYLGGRATQPTVSETVIWSYMVQICSALRAIHDVGLAARIIDLSKVLLTGKNRIRLNACAIMDVVNFDTPRNIVELQRDDLVQFGRLLLAIGTNSAIVIHNTPKLLDQFARTYSIPLKDSILWLLNASSVTSQANNPKIDFLITIISSRVMSAFDETLHHNDALTSELTRELENARLFRITTKLNMINERADLEHDRRWSETGERYYLKLFRDYVYHQVDAQGRPVLDLGHVVTCLNKLDAGLDEKLMLVSRDEQSVFVVSYREIKRGIEAAFGDLMKMARVVG